MVMLIQLLCPDRHCLVAGAYEVGNGDFKSCCESIEAAMKGMGVDRHCGLCGSADVKFEEARTKFETMAEAAPFLAQEMKRNAETRNLLDSMGMTFDSRRRRQEKPHVN